MRIMFAPGLIASCYQYGLKPLLFQFPPETMHTVFGRIGHALASYHWSRQRVKRSFRYDHPGLSQELLGMHFANPVGLAAGFDKNGYLVDLMGEVGFGFSHIGSITQHSYAGNTPPRATRLQESQGIIVNYGLKNEGAATILSRVQPTQPLGPLGVSIAKTNAPETVAVDAAIADYVATVQLCEDWQVGDFYTLNISCPNAYGGEQFTRADLLQELLAAVQEVRLSKPVFLKMPLGLPRDQFAALCQVAADHQVDGLIIANLIKERTGLHEKNINHLPGGVSGKPTWQAANELLSKTYQEFGGEFVLVGTGGIFSAVDAYEKIKRGANLVQLITGMIFQGPQLIGQINKGLMGLLQQDGYTHISEAVGAYHR